MISIVVSSSYNKLLIENALRGEHLCFAEVRNRMHGWLTE